MRVYKVFKVGVKDFYKDLIQFFGIVKSIYTSSKTLYSLPRKDLELYHQMPKDMFKVGPVILFSTLPFAFYVVLPLVYYFPRQLLTHHFWTLQQKSEFNILQLQKRLTHNRPVFRHLQANLLNINKSELQAKWQTILGKIGNGDEPSVNQILEVKSIFSEAPYNLKSLTRSHIVSTIIDSKVKFSLCNVKLYYLAPVFTDRLYCDKISSRVS